MILTLTDVAASELKDLILELQANLLSRLADAEEDDTITDFSALVKNADQTRRKAVNILNNLYNRVQEQDGPEDSAPKTFSRATTAATQISRQPTVIDEPPTPTTKKKSFSFFRSHSNNDPPEQTLPTRQSTKPSLHQPSPSLVPRSPETPPQSRRDTLTAAAASPNLTRRSTTSSTTILSPPLTPQIQFESNTLHPITESNQYAGLCKGAFHALNLNLSKSIERSVKSYTHAYHCKKKCQFRLLAHMPTRENPRFDDRVYRIDTVRFRLMFLLKSHMPQKGARDARQYRCLFCVLVAGDGDGGGGGANNAKEKKKGKEYRRFDSEAHLFEHIARHEGQRMGGTDVDLRGPVEVNAGSVRSCGLADFDLFFPRTASANNVARGSAGTLGTLDHLALPPPAAVSEMGDGGAGDVKRRVDPEDRYSPVAIEWSAEDIFGNVWLREGASELAG